MKHRRNSLIPFSQVLWHFVEVLLLLSKPCLSMRHIDIYQWLANIFDAKNSGKGVMATNIVMIYLSEGSSEYFYADCTSL